jgi:Tol biopolymer transport system component
MQAAGETAISKASPDGKSIAFLVNVPSSQPARALVVVPADGGPSREVYRGYYSSPLPDSLSWTRDGRFLIFGAAEGDDQTFLVIPVTGGQPVQTGLRIRGIQQVRFPSFAPDGRRLTFTGSSREDQLWVVDKLLPQRTGERRVRNENF